MTNPTTGATPTPHKASIDKAVDGVLVGHTLPDQFEEIPHVAVRDAMKLSAWDAKGWGITCKVLAVVENNWLMTVEPDELNDEAEELEFVENFGLHVSFVLGREDIAHAIKNCTCGEWDK